MSKKTLYIITLLVIIVAFVSCEKDITVDLPQPESKVVVDGYVEPGQPVYVVLTRNAPYFAPVDPDFLNIAETGADVKVNDGTADWQLIEIDTTVNGLELKGVYIAPFLIGIVGKTYTLSITTTKGEKLTAVTTLPAPIALDSVWFQIQETLPGNDSLGYVWATLTDPDTLNNCYRWMAKRVGKDSSFIAPMGSSFEDKFINGTTFDFAYNRGAVLNSTAQDDNNDETGFFKKGDSIIVKYCTVDRSVYEFWRDADNQIGSNGSPFASPAPIRSNVNGGLGLFASYSPSYFYLKAE